MKEKFCIKCKIYLSIVYFHKEKKSKDGLGAYCKECKKAYAKEHQDKFKKADKKYKDKNRELLKQRSHKFYYLNRETEIARTKKYNACHSQERSDYGKKYHKTIPGHFTAYKGNAKSKQRTWSLSLEQFKVIVTQPCLYCGDFDSDRHYTGIDRVDNTRGYVLDNCVPCCKVCNYMKRNYTKKVFLNKIKQIQIYNNL